MLSPVEKGEMIEDAASPYRRQQFARGRANAFAFQSRKKARSLDYYLTFLENIQKIFKPFEISKKSTLVKIAKL